MNNTIDQVEYLARRGEAFQIIVSLYDKILACDETERECDVCVGLRYAINTIERRLGYNSEI